MFLRYLLGHVRFFRGNAVGRGVSHLILLDEMAFTRGGRVRSAFSLIRENVEL